MNEKTIFESGTTLKESGTVIISGAAMRLSANALIVRGITLLDTYRVESDAIEGGMGSVWRVHHTGWNVDLAMKRPQPRCFSTEKSKADFIHECEAWIGLGLHPNIVSCYYVREMSGTPTIFSEWMDGGSLEGAIAKGSLYEGTEAEQKARLLDLAVQFARGLHYAHEAGLIHQDVKPDNVLLTKEGEAKVADFGLARARAVLTVLEGDPTMREANSGGRTILSPSGGYTPAYCSMEQMDGKPLTRRTDIYSWAVSVMEMYLGCRPWANGVVAGLGCRGYFENTRVPMSEALKELLAQCLEGEPENRPHDFGEIEAALQEIYAAETGSGYPRPEPKAAADTADSLNNRALSMLDLGKAEEAERLWEAALQTDLSNFRCQYNYAAALWNRRKIDDAEFFARIARQRECSALWAQAMATVSLIRRNDDKEAKEAIDILASIDERMPMLEELRERLAAQLSFGSGRSTRPADSAAIYSIPYGPDAVRCDKDRFTIVDPASGKTRFRLEGDWYFGIDLSRDGQKAVYSLKGGKSYCVLDLTTGSSSVFAWNGVYLGRSCFADAQGGVVACAGEAVRFFDAVNGRSLLTMESERDREDDIIYDRVEAFSGDGLVLIKSFRRELWVKLPDASLRPFYELSVVSSLYERNSALNEAERNCVFARALFEEGNVMGAFRLLDKNRMNSTLLLHEPSLRLWTKLGTSFKHGKLIAVLPTEDTPAPLPQRSRIVEKTEPSRARYATDGTTVATVQSTCKMTENLNNGFDLDYSYSLSACDAVSGQPYFAVRRLTSDSRTDAEELDEELYIDLLPEGRLLYGKRSWNSPTSIDLRDPEIQIERGLTMALPAGYRLSNTKEGVDIGGFRFEDVFDGLQPLWNADIVVCRKRNYRLVYQYIDPEKG